MTKSRAWQCKIYKICHLINMNSYVKKQESITHCHKKNQSTEKEQKRENGRCWQARDTEVIVSLLHTLRTQREMWTWGNKWNIKKNAIYKNGSKISEMKNIVEQINHSAPAAARPPRDPLQRLSEPALPTTRPDTSRGGYILFLHYSVSWGYFFSVWSSNATWTSGGRHPLSSVPLWPLMGILVHSIIDSASIVFLPQLPMELVLVALRVTMTRRLPKAPQVDGFILAHRLRG